MFKVGPLARCVSPYHAWIAPHHRLVFSLRGLVNTSLDVLRPCLLVPLGGVGELEGNRRVCRKSQSGKSCVLTKSGVVEAPSAPPRVQSAETQRSDD